MKIETINKKHLTPQTSELLWDVVDFDHNFIASIGWFEENEQLVRINLNQNFPMHYPHDLFVIYGWAKANDFEYLLFTDEAPIRGNLPLCQ